MHSFRSSCGRLLEITMGICNRPRSSLIFISFPPYAALISIVEFEVLNGLSFIFVILSHTQSRPSVNRSMANSTNMSCPISSRSKMSLETLFHSLPPLWVGCKSRPHLQVPWMGRRVDGIHLSVSEPSSSFERASRLWFRGVVLLCHCCHCRILQQTHAVTWTALVQWGRTYQAPFHSGWFLLFFQSPSVFGFWTLARTHIVAGNNESVLARKHT